MHDVAKLGFFVHYLAIILNALGATHKIRVSYGGTKMISCQAFSKPSEKMHLIPYYYVASHASFCWKHQNYIKPIGRNSVRNPLADFHLALSCFSNLFLVENPENTFKIRFNLKLTTANKKCEFYGNSFCSVMKRFL